MIDTSDMSGYLGAARDTADKPSDGNTPFMLIVRVRGETEAETLARLRKKYASPVSPAVQPGDKGREEKMLAQAKGMAKWAAGQSEERAKVQAVAEQHAKIAEQPLHWLDELGHAQGVADQRAERAAKAMFTTVPLGVLRESFSWRTTQDPVAGSGITPSQFHKDQVAGKLGAIASGALGTGAVGRTVPDAMAQTGPEYTGGSVSYYKVRIGRPLSGDDVYTAECNDIIEALGMNYAEGNAFKALWRRCAARQGKAKAGYKDGLYDAEKVEFFGARLVAQEKAK